MRDIDKSVKSLSDEDWNSMVSVMGKYKGYPVLALKALLLAVINGEPHRRMMINRRKHAATMFYRKQRREYQRGYYLEHKAERFEYNREYRKRNREAYNARIRAYRARKKMKIMNGEAEIANEA